MFSVVVIVFLAAIVALNLVLIGRLQSSNASEARLRDEIGRMRLHYSDEARALREELALSLIHI